MKSMYTIKVLIVAILLNFTLGETSRKNFEPSGPRQSEQ